MKCQICNKDCNKLQGLGIHIHRTHNMKRKTYYDKFIRINKDEGKCLVCKRDTFFCSLGEGYQETCSYRCAQLNPKTQLKIKSTTVLKYGVDNASKSEVIKRRKEETCLKNFGVKYSAQSPEVIKRMEKTCLKNWGGKNYMKSEKGLKDFRKKMVAAIGYENPYQSPKIQDEIKKRNLERCGSEWPSHKAKPYKLPSGKIIEIQGYEPNFLDYVFDNKLLSESEIEKCKIIIPYKSLDGKNRRYHPDFYIPKLNLIVEIKSTWYEMKDKNVEEKMKATIKAGFKYLRIVDNDFSKVPKILAA